ncbi:MAG: hypothetical protein PHZ00_05350, partial [Candidatus Peribacteraceae bacterium]|nr:hypothetical protein [Candidatus Peribacteraceae bacterium]
MQFRHLIAGIVGSVVLLVMGGTVVFAQSSSELTLGSSANPSAFGSGLTLTATITPATATGTVTFKDNGTTIGTG